MKNCVHCKLNISDRMHYAIVDYEDMYFRTSNANIHSGCLRQILKDRGWMITRVYKDELKMEHKLI